MQKSECRDFVSGTPLFAFGFPLLFIPHQRPKIRSVFTTGIKFRETDAPAKGGETQNQNRADARDEV